MTSNDLVYTLHSRSFAEYRFVYPVISRRSGGLSVGVNLNPDKVCNFDCIYCQVDRRSESETRFVELPQLCAELDQMLQLAVSGDLFRDGPLRGTPVPLQGLRDIAFSGDGEPTTFRNLDEIIQACGEIKHRHNLSNVKMVLITNASMFHRPRVKLALERLDHYQGEIWGKLDAGTAEYFEQVERTTIPFQRILDNLTDAARRRPIVIQSIFIGIAGVPPASEEVEAYCQRLVDILQAGGQIRLVQVYTLARRPAESMVSALSDEQVDAIALRVRQRTGLPVNVYFGVTGLSNE